MFQQYEGLQSEKSKRQQLLRDELQAMGFILAVRAFIEAGCNDEAIKRVTMRAALAPGQIRPGTMLSQPPQSGMQSALRAGMRLALHELPAFRERPDAARTRCAQWVDALAVIRNERRRLGDRPAELLEAEQPLH